MKPYPQIENFKYFLSNNIFDGDKRNISEGDLV